MALANPRDISAISTYLNKQGLAKRSATASYLQVFDAVIHTIRGTGYGLKPGPFEAIGQVMDGELRISAFEALQKVVDGLGFKLHIFIDETDQEWHLGDRDSVMRLLTGIVDVVFNAYFDENERSVYPRNLRLKVFLRDEAYATCPFANARVLGSRTTKLTWDRNSLFKMICQRLGIATGHRDKDPNFVWETTFPRSLSFAPKRHTFDYLLTYTFGRPRDIIDLCQQCINEAADRDKIKEVGQRIVGKVEEHDIKTVIPVYCKKFVDYEITEAKIVFPECTALLSRFTNKPWVEKPDYFVKNVIRPAKHELSIHDEEERLLQKLWEFGFFGAIVEKPVPPLGGHGLEKIFWYDDRILNLMQAKHLIVHPVFHKTVALSPSQDPLGEL